LGQIGYPQTVGTTPYVHQSKSVATFSGIHLCDLYFLVIAARSSKSSAKVSASGFEMVSGGGVLGFSLYSDGLGMSNSSILVLLGHGEQEIGTIIDTNIYEIFCNLQFGHYTNYVVFK